MKRFARIYKDAALILFNTLVLLLVLEAVAAVLLRLWPASDVFRDDTPSYYRTESWGAEFLRDEKGAIEDVVYAPYVMWKTRPHEGRYVHVDQDGNRVVPGAVCEPGAYKVFMFGGSTMWGDGVPDWGTIPAYLQQDLSRARQTPVCVRNFGQPGWVSSQNLIELTRRLQAGDVPDVAIFYDGFNDVGVPWSGGIAGGPYQTNSFKDRLEGHGIRRTFVELVVWTHIFRVLEQLVPSVSALHEWPSRYTPPVVDVKEATTTIVRTYVNNYTAVKALAGAYRFEYAMFWQPSLFYTARQTTAEEQVMAAAERAERPDMPALLTAVYDQIKIDGRGLDHLFVIADLFEKASQGVYLDSVHLTHVGNRDVATRMMEALRVP